VTFTEKEKLGQNYSIFHRS